jgi:cytidylate kinase
LRTENVSRLSSKIAILPIIRKFINDQQKIIVKKKLYTFKGCVIDGRDIGTKVFKSAKIKLFINVKPTIRAKRRHKQLIALGEKSIYAQILKEIKLRDRIDINRIESPLIPAKGAIFIDNSLTFINTIKQLNQVIRKI